MVPARAPGRRAVSLDEAAGTESRHAARQRFAMRVGWPELPRSDVRLGPFGFVVDERDQTEYTVYRGEVDEAIGPKVPVAAFYVDQAGAIVLLEKRQPGCDLRLLHQGLPGIRPRRPARPRSRLRRGVRAARSSFQPGINRAGVHRPRSGSCRRRSSRPLNLGLDRPAVDHRQSPHRRAARMAQVRNQGQPQLAPAPHLQDQRLDGHHSCARGRGDARQRLAPSARAVRRGGVVPARQGTEA